MSNYLGHLSRIGFISEISNLCELVGADVGEVAYGIGLNGCIGTLFPSAGTGWRGACLPKDVAALQAVAKEYEHQTLLLEAAVSVNERQRKRVVVRLQRELRTVKGKRLSLLGLSFKPNTDGLKEPPSLHIVRLLDSWVSGSLDTTLWLAGRCPGSLRPPGRRRPLCGVDGSAPPL